MIHKTLYVLSLLSCALFSASAGTPNEQADPSSNPSKGHHQLSGHVVDASGAPIPRGRVHPLTWNAEACVFGSDGRFRFDAVPAGEHRISIAAPKRSPFIATLRVEKDQHDWRVVLRKSKVRQFVLSLPDGSPIPGVKLVAKRWNLDPSLQFEVSPASDPSGRVRWEGLPDSGLLEVRVHNIIDTQLFVSSLTMVCEEGGDIELPVYPWSHVEGRVVDAETGLPIKSFQLYRGHHMVDGDETWKPSRLIEHEDGRFAYEEGFFLFDTALPPPTFFARIVVDGYVPERIKTFSAGDQPRNLIVRMRKGTSWTGRVVDSNMQPVADAKAVWLDQDRTAFIRQGELVFGRPNSRHAYIYASIFRATTDKDGHFRLPPQDEEGTIVIANQKGYWSCESSQFTNGSTVVLTPWARVKGRVAIPAMNRGGDTRVRIEPTMPKDQVQESRILWQLDAVTDGDGAFEFSFVPAMPISVGLPFTQAAYSGLTHNVLLSPEPGERCAVLLGSDTGGLSGRFEVKSPLGQTAYESPFSPDAVRVVATMIDTLSNNESAATDSMDQHVQQFVGTGKDDGRFAIQGLPDGSYLLEVALHAHLDKNSFCSRSPVLAEGRKRIRIQDGASDAGTVHMVLHAKPTLEAGAPAPSLVSTELNGAPFNLAKQRGSIVVLDFWASWCAPCMTEMPRFKRLWTHYREDARIEFVGVNFDGGSDSAQRLVKRHGYGWTHVNAGLWTEDNPVIHRFGLAAIPSYWLLDREGRILARDIPPANLESSIDKLLNEIDAESLPGK